MSAELFTIGSLARQARVGIETIRFYERQGLIPEPARRPSGYRQYPAGSVSQILFIRRAKELGFSLREIKELLSLRVQPGSTRGDIRSRAEAKICNIEEKIRTLQKMKKALVKLVASCKGGARPASECPILEALEGKAGKYSGNGLK